MPAASPTGCVVDLGTGAFLECRITFSPVPNSGPTIRLTSWPVYGAKIRPTTGVTRGADNDRAKDRLKELFCPRAEAWRSAALRRSLGIVDQALRGLCALDHWVAPKAFMGTFGPRIGTGSDQSASRPSRSGLRVRLPDGSVPFRFAVYLLVWGRYGAGRELLPPRRRCRAEVALEASSTRNNARRKCSPSAAWFPAR